MAGGFGCGIGGRRNFISLLCSLLNFRVKVVTEGEFRIRGILSDVNFDFITISGEEICFIPICEIVAICRDFTCTE